MFTHPGESMNGIYSHEAQVQVNMRDLEILIGFSFKLISPVGSIADRYVFHTVTDINISNPHVEFVAF